MTPDSSTGLNPELLDDFYAECDELLTALRQDLVRLEQAAGLREPAPDAVEGAYRATHSLKGNCGIAGLRTAEGVAHAMEEVMRGLTKNTLPLSRPLVDALMQGARRFEEIVASHRQGTIPPETGDVLALLAFAAQALPAGPGPEPVLRREDSGEAFSLAPEHIVRVGLARLDDMMRITGELVIHRSKLEERLGKTGGDDGGIREVAQALGRSLREMRSAVTRARLVPAAEIFNRIPFLVRDLARDAGKQVRVSIEGQHTEVDKYLVERLKEPVLQLVRNAFAHGLETPMERSAAGKPPEGTIFLAARGAGDSVVIEVRDDGRGIDAAVVGARAAALGLAVPSELDAAALLAILCAPGFSTREEADLAAGRGVGMTIVAQTLRELGGTLSLETAVGAGSTFRLKFPLTLSITDAFVVSIGAHTCAVPQHAVEEIFQVPSREARLIRNTPVVPYRSGLLPIVRSRAMFKLGDSPDETLTILVVGADRGRAGLVVDGVLGRREIVVRSLADPLVQVRGISGAAELGDGHPVLILDPAAITEGVVRAHDSA